MFHLKYDGTTTHVPLVTIRQQLQALKPTPLVTENKTIRGGCITATIQYNPYQLGFRSFLLSTGLSSHFFFLSHLGHELDGDLSVGVGVLEVVDQLRQVLDGVNVVVGRGGNKAHPRGRVPVLGDVLGHLQ